MKNPPEKPGQGKKPGKSEGFDKINRNIGSEIEQRIVKGARRMDPDNYNLIYRNVGESPCFAGSANSRGQRHVKAFAQQKIVILPESLLDKIKEQKSFSVGFDDQSETKAVLVRASEFPNHPSEYPDFKENTYTALIEWTHGPRFADLVSIAGTAIGVDVCQLDNVTINEGGGSGNRPPGDPIVEGNTASLTPFPVQSDYKKVISNYTVGKAKTGAVTVAVTDTGSLFLRTDYLSSKNNRLRYFPLIKNENFSYPGGYCSVTKYLDPDYRRQMIKVNTPNQPTTEEEVLQSPYDDNAARHGTTVAAIIAQNPGNDNTSSATILPVKCFDFLGAANLFDILCGFNYIFSRIKTENIRIVNASWGFYAPREKEDQLDILRKKILALKKEHIFVVTSAGNRPKLDEPAHNLNDGAIYPACFRSKELDNLISVTTVTYDLGFSQTGNDSPFLNDKIVAHLKKGQPEGTKVVQEQLVHVENYSADFVDVGVVAHPFQGLFSSPFKDKSGKNTEPAVISGSSFAAGYVTAYLAEALRLNPDIKTKEEFFAGQTNISQSADLTDVTAGGTYLTLPIEEYDQVTSYVANYIMHHPLSLDS